MADEPTAERSEILTRLRRVEGQIRGIQRMIDADRDCESVITQLMAARAALDRVSRLILSHHLAHCLANQALEPDRAQLDRILEFLIKLPTAPADDPASCEDLS